MLPNVDCFERANALLRMIADAYQRCRDGCERKDTAYALEQAERIKRQSEQLVFNLDLADLIQEHNARTESGPAATGGK